MRIPFNTGLITIETDRFLFIVQLESSISKKKVYDSAMNDEFKTVKQIKQKK